MWRNTKHPNEQKAWGMKSLWQNLKQKLRNGQKLKFGSYKIALKVWRGNKKLPFKSISKVMLENKQNIKDNCHTKV